MTAGSRSSSTPMQVQSKKRLGTAGFSWKGGRRPKPKLREPAWLRWLGIVSTRDALREVNSVSKSFSRRRFSVLVAGAIVVPVVGVTPRLATAQDATPGATPSAATGAESLAQMEGRVFSTGPQGE